MSFAETQYNSNASRVLARAKSVASRHGHRVAHPEHILVALAESDTTYMLTILRTAFNVPSTIASHLVPLSPDPYTGVAEWSVESRDVLETARQVRDHSDDRCTTRDLLMGVVSKPTPAVDRLLALCGTSAASIREYIYSRMTIEDDDRT